MSPRRVSAVLVRVESTDNRWSRTLNDRYGTHKYINGVDFEFASARTLGPEYELAVWSTPQDSYVTRRSGGRLLRPSLTTYTYVRLYRTFIGQSVVRLTLPSVAGKGEEGERYKNVTFPISTVPSHQLSESDSLVLSSCTAPTWICVCVYNMLCRHLFFIMVARWYSLSVLIIFDMKKKKKL